MHRDEPFGYPQPQIIVLAGSQRCVERTTNLYCLLTYQTITVDNTFLSKTKSIIWLFIFADTQTSLRIKGVVVGIYHAHYFRVFIPFGDGLRNLALFIDIIAI